MVDPAGALANHSGSGLECTIRNVVEHNGFVEVTDAQKKIVCKSLGVPQPDMYHYAWYIRQAPIEKNIYGGRSKSDFYLYCPTLFPNGLHIESKWQSSAGSVDEKYVFTVESMAQYNSPGILVVEGGGTRPNALLWMKERAKKTRGHLKVMMLGEFIKEANGWGRVHRA